jgi:hypothetical protein
MPQEDCSLDDENLISLSSLEIPKIVSGSFLIDTNKLENLIGSPEEVYEYMNASHNELKTLYGSPNKLNSGFILFQNFLISIDFLSFTIGGHIWII